jgi:hypothetical protein
VRYSPKEHPIQAAVYYGRRDIRVEDVPMPELAEEELLVRLQACGICGSDLQQRDSLEAVIELTDGPRPIGRFEVKRGHTDTVANPSHLSGHNTWLSLSDFKKRHAFFLTPMHTMVYTGIKWLLLLPWVGPFYRAGG